MGATSKAHDFGVIDGKGRRVGCFVVIAQWSGHGQGPGLGPTEIALGRRSDLPWDRVDAEIKAVA